MLPDDKRYKETSTFSNNCTEIVSLCEFDVFFGSSETTTSCPLNAVSQKHSEDGAKSRLEIALSRPQ